MNPDQLTQWAVDHPWPAVGAATAVLGLAAAFWAIARFVRSTQRPPAPVLVAAAGALVCTAYTADTSWRFAAHQLGMNDLTERLLMFAAAEIALLACAVMARANKAATATETTAGSAGTPGALVWLITGVQIIPAYSESGIVGGTVRAIIGPVMAGLLWHLAMGLEIRVVRPGALSTGLPAMLGREVRERLLSRLGLAVRDRDAAQITADRATKTAVRLASRKKRGPWARHRLAAAVTRSGAATSGERRHQLMQQLAARRTSAELATVPVPSPWTVEPAPEPYPRTPLGVTSAELRRLDPMDAILRVQAAHLDATPAELSSLCTQYGVPVSEMQVRIATRAGSPPPQVQAVPVLPALPEAEVDHSRGLVLELTGPYPGPHPMEAPALVLAAGHSRREVHARVPAEGVPGSIEDPIDFIKRRAREEREKREATPPSDASTAVPDGLLGLAREIDDEHRRTNDGRPAPIRVLKRELHIGQPAAQQLQARLKQVQP